MVKALKKWDLWNWRGLVLGLAQTAIIGLVAWVFMSASTIAQGAKMGRQSFEKVVQVEHKVDSIAEVQRGCERKQDVINIGIIKDVDWIKQSLIRIENKL